MSSLSFKVTVEFICDNMVNDDEFTNDFNSDPMLVYKFISDDFGDSVLNFSSDSGKVIKVELAKESKQ